MIKRIHTTWLKYLLVIFITIMAMGVCASKAFALACNDQASNDWDNPATWDCGIIPDSDDTVTIDSHTVTLTGNEEVDDIDISGGTLTMNSFNLRVGGSWDATGGAFSATTGQVVFTSTDAGGETITSNGNSFNDLTISDGLVAYWKMDEKSSSDSILDYSGYSHDGTRNGAAGTNNLPQPSTELSSAIDFTNPRSLDFDGDDDYLRVTDTADLKFDSGDSITIAGWVRPEQNSGYGTFIAKGRIDTANRANYAFRQSVTGQKLDFYYRNSALTQYQVWSSTADIFTVTNQYYHVAVTYTFADASSIAVYVDGSSVAGSWITGTGNEAPDMTTQDLQFGEIRLGVGNEAFEGQIDDFRIYNRKLSASEVARLASGSHSATAATFTLQDDLDVDGTLMINSGTLDTGANRAISVDGNVLYFGGAFVANSNTVTFSGGGSQTITTGFQSYNNVTFNNAAGTWTTADDMDVNGQFNLTNGTFVNQTGTLSVAGNFTLAAGTTYTKGGTLLLDGDLIFTDNTAGGQDLGTVWIGTSPDTTDLATDMVATNLTVNAGDVLNTNGFDVDLSGTLIIDGTVDATDDVAGDTTNINLEGNWDLNATGTFIADDSTVILDGDNASQTITGDNRFYNLTKIESSDDSTDSTLTFEAGSVQTIESTLTLQGIDSDDRVNIVSDSGGTEFTFYNRGSTMQNTGSLDISDSHVSGSSIIASNSLNTSNTDAAAAAPHWVFVDEYTWVGDGGSNNWNVDANWYGGSVPGATDIAVFNEDVSGEDCNINAAVNVAGFDIRANYTGTITQNSNTITIGTSHWTQAGGTFSGGDAAFSNSGTFDLSGGSFTATSSTWTQSGASTSVTISGGTFMHNSGLLTLTNSVTTDTGSNSFNDITFNGNATFTVTGSLIASNDLTITTAATIDGGDIAVAGDVTTTDSTVAGTAQVLFNGTGAQALGASGGTGELPGVAISKTGGTLTVSDTINIDAGGWTYGQGTVDMGTSTIVATETATYSTGSMTFNNLTFNGAADDTVTISGTIDVDGDVTISIIGTVTGGDVDVAGNIVTTDAGVDGTAVFEFDGAGAQTLEASGGTGEVSGLSINKSGGTLTIQDVINVDGGGITYVQGTVDASTSTIQLTDTMTVSSSTVAFNQVVFTGSSALTFVGTMDIDGTLTASSVASLTSGTLALSNDVIVSDGAISGNTVFLFEGTADQTLNAGGGAGDLTGVTINKSGGTLTIEDSFTVLPTFTYVQGTVDASTSTITFIGSMTIDSGSVSFNNVAFAGGSDTVITGTMDVDGDFTLTSWANFDSGVVTIAGDLTTTDAFGNGDTVFILDGTGNQTFSASGGSGKVPGIEVDKASGTLTLQDELWIDEGGWTYTQGTVDAGTSRVYINCTACSVASAGMTFNNVALSAGTITVTGTMDVNGTLSITALTTFDGGVAALGGNVDIDDSSVSGTALMYFDGTMGQSFDLVSAAGLDNDIEINKTGGTVHLLTDMSPNGAGQDLTITSGTLDVNGFDLTFTGNSFSVEDGGILQLQGDESVTQPTLNAGSTVSYDGNSGAYTVLDWNYRNLRIGTDSLLRHWRLDETSAGVPVKGSALGAHGTASGVGGANNLPQPSTTVASVNFSNPRSLNFDGTDDYIRFDPVTELQSNSVFTISFWASSSSYFLTDAGISIRDGTAASPLFIIYPFDTLNGNGVRVYWNGNHMDQNDGAIADGNMHHFLFVSRSATDHEMFVDGESIATNSGSIALPATISNINIGCWYPGAQHFTGNIDDIRIYNRALSNSEILALYNGDHLVQAGNGEDFNLGAAESIAEDLIVVNGTFDLAGNDLTVTGAVSNDDHIRLEGGETVSIGTQDGDSGTVRYDGTANPIFWVFGDTYYNVEFIGSGSWFASSDMDVNGSLIIEAGAVADNGNDINLAGNFIHSGGTFTATGTLVLDGTDQTIYDSTTFNNLHKDVATADTLTFETGETQTISGTLQLNGDTGQLLTLQGTEEVLNQWYIDAQGGRDVSYLDVINSNNLDSTFIDCTDNCTNSGNNDNWLFTAAVISFTGNVFTDKGVTSIGAGKTIAVSVQGAAAAATDDTDGAGEYMITGVTANSGDIITLYIDDEAEQGVLVTASNDEDIMVLDIYQDYLIVRQDNNGFIENTDLAISDNNGDTDITDIYSVSAGNTLQVTSTKSLFIPSPHNYFSSGAITTGTMDIAGTLDAEGYSITVAGDWINTGSFAHTGTVTFNGGGISLVNAGGTGTSTDDSTKDFAGVEISNSTLVRLTSTEMEIDGTLEIGSGSITDLNGQDLDLNGLLINNGELRLEGDEDVAIGTMDTDSGLVKVDGTSSVTLTAGISEFYNLTIDEDGTSDPTITIPNQAILVNGTLTVADATLALDDDRFFDVLGNVIIQDTLTISSGIIRTGGDWDASGGSFSATTGQVIFASTTTANITSNGSTFYDASINDGLIGYWKLDESAAGSTVIDYSGYNHTLTPTGAGGTNNLPQPVMNRSGTINFDDQYSLDFDGTDDYLSGSMAGAKTSGGSFAFWLYYRTSTSNDGFLVSSNIAPMVINSGGSIRMLLADEGNAACPCNVDITDSADIPLGEWVHYAGTWDSTGGVLYRNGVAVGSDVVSTTFNAMTNIFIGSDRTIAGRYIDGMMDDVRVYNRALTANEVAQLANGNQPDTSLGTYTLQDAMDVDGTLFISTGTLDTGSDRAISVEGGWINNNGGFISNNNTVTFDGTNTGQFMWTHNNVFYNWTINGSGGEWTLFDNLTITNTANLTDGTFTYTTGTIAEPLELTGDLNVNGGTFAGQAPDFKINGQLDLSSGTVTAPSGTLAISDLFSHSGGTFTHNSGTVIWTGTGTYTPDLSGGTTFNNLYLSSFGLVGHWSMDDADMLSAVTDTSGRGNNGTLNTGLNDFAINGVLGQAVKFDGVDDEIVLDGANETDFSDTNAFSISFWLYTNTTSTAGNMKIISRGSTQTSAANEVYNIGYGFADPTRLSVRIGDGTTIDGYTSAIGTLPTLEWVHIAVRWDGSTATAYVNNTEVINSAGTVTGINTGGTNTFSIGADAGADRYYCDCSIDDVRIYNRAITDAEIADLSRGAIGTSGSFTLSDTLTVAGDLINDKTLDLNGNTLAVTGGYESTGTLIAQGDETITLGTDGEIFGVALYDGAVTSTIDAEITGYRDLVFNNAGGTWTLPDIDLVVTGSLTITNGTVNADDDKFVSGQDITIADTLAISSGDVRVSRYWDPAGGSFSATTGQVMFTSTTNVPVTSNGSSFYNLTLNDGLIGYWKLDETASGLTVRDHSGYGHHGVASGSGGANNLPQPSTEVSGTIHFSNPRSYNFDSTDDEVLISLTDVLSVTGPVTMAAWINRTDDSLSGGGGGILGKDSKTGGGSDTGVAFELNDSTSTPAGKLQCSFPGLSDGFLAGVTVVSNNQWHHVACVYDGENTFIYLDGELENTEVSTGKINQTNLPWRIGKSTIEGGGQNRFNGYIDEARLYNRGLSAAEIALLANGYQPNEGSATFTLADNLDVNGTLMINSGTLDAGSDRSINVVGSWFNHGGSFISNNNTVTFDGTLTGNAILSSSSAFYNWSIDGSGGEWTLNDDITVSNNGRLSDGTLTYSTDNNIEPITYTGSLTVEGGTFTGVAQDFKHDGQLTISSGTYTAPSGTLAVSGTFGHSAGTFTHNSGVVMWTGTGSYTQDLSAGTSFNDLYLSTYGLIAHWSMDDQNVNSQLTDTSGKGNHGALVNPGEGKNGKLGQAIEFSDNRATVGSPDELDDIELQGGGGKSITAWIYPYTANTEDIIAEKGSFGITNGEWKFGLTSTARLFYQRGYAGANLEAYTASSTIATDQWQFVAMTWDGSATAANVHLYINGVQTSHDVEVDATGAKGSDASNSLLLGDGINRNFDGLIDDIRIYNRVLTANEIADLNRGFIGTSGSFTLNDTLTVGGDLINDKSIDLNGNTLAVTGEFESTGTFQAQGDETITLGTDDDIFGVAIYDGAVTSTIDIEITGYRDLTFNNAGGDWTLPDINLAATGSFTISAGTVNLDDDKSFTTQDVTVNDTLAINSGDLRLSGLWDSSGGSFSATTGQVMFTSTVDHSLASNGSSFYDLILNDGLIGYWGFDEESANSCAGGSNDACDSSGYKNDGAWNNNTTSDTNIPVFNFRNNRSVTFDGTDDYITMGDIDEVDKATALTVSAWVYHDGLSQDEGIVNIGDGTDGILFIRDDMASTSGRTDTYKVLIAEPGSSDNIEVEGATNASSAATWTHVAFTFEADSATGLRLYINGVEDANSPVDASSIETIDLGTDEVYVGNDAALASDFSGEIDDVRIYNRVLSATEIAALAAGDQPQTGLATLTLEDTLDVTGSLIINSGTLDVNSAEDNAISVAGNWINNGGDFLARSGTVTLDGSDQIINSSETFYNLSKTESTNDSTDVTLTIGQGSTQTIQNTLTLDALDDDDRINIRSSTTGSIHIWDVTGGDQVTDYLDVQDSHASSNNIIVAEAIDSGNTDNDEVSPRWVLGTIISGTTNLADSTVIRWAENATLRSKTTMVVTGSFSMTVTGTIGVGNVLTVWADSVANNLETTAVTEYQQSGDVTGLYLYSGTLSMGHTEGTMTLLMTELGQYDNDDDEDILYVLSAGNTLQSSISRMNLYIQTGTFDTDGYELEVGGTMQIDGTLDATSGNGGNTTIEVGGGWIGTTGTFLNTDSTVVFTGTMDTETFGLYVSSSKSLDNVKFDDSGGGTTWELQGTMTVDGTFYLADGIVDTNSTNNYGWINTGTFQTAGGAFMANASTVTANSDFLVSVDDTFVPGTSTVDLTGTGSLTCVSTDPCLYNINVAAAGETTTITNTIYVGNIITVNSGVLTDVTSQIVLLGRASGAPVNLDNAGTISIYGWYYASGTDTVAAGDHQVIVLLRPSSETYTLDGTLGASTLYIAENSGVGTATLDTTSNNYPITLSDDLRFGRSGVPQWQGHLIGNASTITIADDFVVGESGTLNSIRSTTGTIYIGGNWDASKGLTQRLGTSTVVFNGTTGTSTISFPTTGTVGIFGNILVDDGDGGSDLVVQMSGTLDMTGTLRITDGSFVSDGYEMFVDGNVDIDDELDLSSGTHGNTTMYFGGDWDMTGGTFTSTDTSVYFTGTMDAALTSDSKAFNNFGINDGLLAYWKFDETTAGSFTDSSGYNATATGIGSGGANNTPQPSMDLNGTINFANSRSIDFDGSDDYVDTGYRLNFSASDSFTFAFWFKLDDTTYASDQDFMGVIEGTQEIAIEVDGDGSLCADDTIVFYVEDDSGGGRDDLCSGYLADDTQWHHLAAVFNVGSGNLEIYIGGVQINTTPITAGSSGAKTFTDTLFIGANNGSGTANQFFDGQMDDFRIYRRALDQAEIAALANGNQPQTGAATLTLQDALDVDGTLFINSGTLDVGSDQAVTVAGNWINNGGDFVAQNGTVTLDGTDQEINSSETFYNLTKAEVTDDSTDSTLTVGRGSTLTIENTLTIDGLDSDDLINIRSSTTGSIHIWDVTGGDQTVSYVDVQDSHASSNDITTDLNSVNSGNTDRLEASPHWVFASIISGTTNLPDSTVIRWAENATLRSNTTMAVTGSFSMSVTGTIGVGNVITVWADSVADSLEATAVTEFQQAGDVTGLILQSGTLSMGHTEGTMTLTMTELGQYDNNDDEDIVYVLTAANNLESVLSTMGLIITNGTFATDGYNMDINGTLQFTGTLDASSGSGGNTNINLLGPWDATGGVFISTDSTVIFTGTSASDLTITSNGQAFNNVTINDGLIAYWKMDESSASDMIMDSSGYGFHGSSFGAGGDNNLPQPSRDVGVAGLFANPYSKDFDGTDDAIVTANVEYNSSVITLAFWYMDEEITTDNQILFESSSNFNANDKSFLIYRAKDSTHCFDKVTASIQDSVGGNKYRAECADLPVLGEWTHYTIILDNSTTTGDVTFYVNGVVQTESVGVNTKDQAGNFATLPFYIGARNGGTLSANAKLDDVRIYNRALTSTEISQLASTNQPHTGLGTFVLEDAMDVNGTLTIHSGTLDVSSSDYAITVAGNWANHGGSFVPQAGTVTFDGASQALDTSESFHNFSKNVTSADTFVVAEKAMVTITGTMQMTGQAGQLLTLQSSSDGDSWFIDPTGSRTADFLDVKDSTNIDETLINPTNSSDSGNTFNWFGVPDQLSGTVFSDEGITALGSVNVQLVNEGVVVAQTTTAGDGTYSLNLNAEQGDTVLIYINDESEDGVTATVAENGAMSSIDIYTDRFIIREDNSTVLTNSLLNGAEVPGETDISNIFNVMLDELNVLTDKELWIPPTGTFQPGANVNTHDVDINGMLIMDSNDLIVSGSFDATGGVFTSSAQVIFTSTDSETITSAGNTFNDFMINDGLVAYWKFDEPSASDTVIDSSGYGNNGTASGAGGANNLPQPDTDVSGTINFANDYGKDFDGDDDAITIPFVEYNSDIITFAFWYKSNNNTDTQVLFESGNNANSTDKAFFIVPKNNGGGCTNLFTVTIQDSSTANRSRAECISLPTVGEWNHYAIVIDNSTTSGDIIIYKNGVSQSTTLASNTKNQSGDFISIPLYIGGRTATSLFSEGVLDDVRIYNRALTQGEAVILTNGYQPQTGLGTFTLQDALDVDGTLFINSGTLDVGADNAITVAGNWMNNGGDFVAQNGTVTLDGTDQEINSSETFYNLTKTETTNDSTDVTLTIGRGSTQTITNTLTLDGLDSDDLINIRSSTTGSIHIWDVTGGVQNVSFLDVQDSNASSNDINASNSVDTNNTDSGEASPHWVFVGSGPLKGAIIIVE